jgi:hypothetical protein
MQLLGVEVSRSDRGRKIRWGLGLGAVFGAITYKLWADHHYVEDEFNAVGAVVLGVPVGGVVGGLVGAALATERWLPVDVGSGVGARPQLYLRLGLPQ